MTDGEQTCVTRVVDYARRVALSPVERGETQWETLWSRRRFSAARTWFWLDRVWQVRCGTAVGGIEWRDSVVVAARAHANPDLIASAMESAETEVRGWEPGAIVKTTPAAAVAEWYREASVHVFDAMYLAATAAGACHAQGDEHVVVDACQHVAAALIASAAAVEAHLNGRSKSVEGLAVRVAARDRVLVTAPVPVHWRDESQLSLLPEHVAAAQLERLRALCVEGMPGHADGVGSRIADAVREQIEASARVFDEVGQRERE